MKPKVFRSFGERQGFVAGYDRAKMARLVVPLRRALCQRCQTK